MQLVEYFFDSLKQVKVIVLLLLNIMKSIYGKLWDDIINTAIVLPDNCPMFIFAF